VCGEKERDVISKQGHPKFVRTLEELDANHLELFMQDLEHELPHGYDERMGVDRYRLVHDFFDRYLKVDEKLPPVVLLISPRDGKADVSATQEIFVHFAPAMDEKAILEKNAIRVSRVSDKKAVKGQWKVSHGGTRFTFTPQEPLDDHAEFQVTVTSKVEDRAGTRLDKEKSVRFRVSESITQ
jgi:hypothetical protein